MARKEKSLRGQTLSLRHAALMLCFFSAVASAANLAVDTGGKTAEYSLADLQSALKTVTVKIDDPNYHVVKEFEAFELDALLKFVGITGGDELAFHSYDGFAPSIAFAALKKHRGYLVFREAGGAPLARMEKGKGTIDPGPFYLAWADGAKAKYDLPWPYQLVKIETIDWAKKFALLAPRVANESERRGFALFRANCVACHSINLQGGEVGPELNVPRNVTEYWKAGELRKFIREASSFRAKIKMPPFTHLKDAEIGDLLAYLTVMKKYKAMPQAAPN